MRRIKRVNAGRAELIHVETALVVVNIYLGLSDEAGHAVETVEMIPDQYAGEFRVTVQGRRFVRETEAERNEREAREPDHCATCGAAYTDGDADEDYCPKHRDSENPPDGWEECEGCGAAGTRQTSRETAATIQTEGRSLPRGGRNHAISSTDKGLTGYAREGK